jgi:cytoskeletal protein CcmA (bactofilin family)
MPAGRDLTLTGSLTASEDVTIDFALEGAIDVGRHDLVVAEGARVHAAVTAASVVVHGRFDGHISADRVELTPSAVVTASIVSPHLLLDDGAQFSGPVNTERAHAAQSVARHRQKAAMEA